MAAPALAFAHQNPIEQAREFVRGKLVGDSSGHDWWHVERVWRMAKVIAGDYAKVDLDVVELSALLHDVLDWKTTRGNAEIGPTSIKIWLQEHTRLGHSRISHVCHNIRHISFKGGTSEAGVLSLEGQIVQDADRLDALGAIGIARTFAYGGKSGQPMHEPDVVPVRHANEAAYIRHHFSGKCTSINHFHEKLLLLKDLMNTDAARRIAEKRHEFLLAYLAQFHSEWDSEV